MNLKPRHAVTAMTIFLIGLAGPVVAHVSLEKSEAAVGAAYKAVVKVPHGCKGAPTVKVEVKLPEGFIGAKPMPKPGWKLATTTGAYKSTHEFYHGTKLSEGVTAVTWSDGELADEHYDEFAVSGYIARELEAGDALYFPVVQTCTKGELKWVEIPGPGVDAHDLAAPAAALKLVAAETKSAAAAPAEIKVGALVIETAFARATPPGATVGAGYLTIRNTGAAPDRLVSVTFATAERVEIHEMTEKDGVMNMRELSGGLEIPAGGTVELAPGGTHLMLMGLKQPLVAGATVKAKLKFEKSGEVEVEIAVRPLGAEKPKHSHH